MNERTLVLPSLEDKTVILTGANSGIGFETAHALYERGAHITLACRSAQSAEDTVRALKEAGGTGQLEIGLLDLSDLESVKRFAQSYLEDHDRLDILINNAGVASPPLTKTAQGFELQFGVNFLGHFALTSHLYPLLRKTPDAKIATLTSNGYQGAEIDFENLRAEKGYEPLREYRSSKLANLVFSIELDRRIKAQGDEVSSVAVQPGANKTNLTRHLSDEEIELGVQRLGEFMEPRGGALCVLFACFSPEMHSGMMCEPEEGGYRGYPRVAAINDNARNPRVARALWELAEISVGQSFPGRRST